MIHYHVEMVIFSILVSIFSCYISLNLFEKASILQGKHRIIWLGYAGTVFGLGVWTMHFLSMLGMKMNIPTYYDWPLTIFSLFVPIVISFFSFYSLNRYLEMKKSKYITAFLVSLGIIVMHHIGLEAIEINGRILMDIDYFIYSLIATFLISLIWIYSIGRSRNPSTTTFMNRWVIALIMGSSIPIMHYISMMGVMFIPFDMYYVPAKPSMNNILIMLFVIIVTGIVLLIGVVSTAYDRKLLLEASRIGELKYQSLFDHNPDAIFTFNKEGDFTSVNPAGEKLTGYSKEQLLNTGFMQLITKKDKEKTFHHFQEALNGDSQEYEITFTHKFGKEIMVHVKNVPIIINDQVVGVYGICKDITDLNFAERELREKESLYRSTMSVMSEALVVINQEEKTIFANHNAAKAVGMEYDEFVSVSTLDPDWLFIKEDGTHYSVEETPVYRTLYRGESCQGIIIGINGFKDNVFETTMWISLNTEPLYKEGKLDGVVATYSNISSLLEQDRQLKISNGLMHTLIENLRFGVLLEDSKMNITLINKEALLIMGMPSKCPSELIGKPLSILETQFEKGVSDYPAVKLRTKEIVEARKFCSDEIYTFNGRVIERTYVPIFLESNYQGHFWKIEDITQQRMLSESLIKAKEDAEKANSSKSAFLSKMSHELRTPLNAILGFGQILEYDTEEPLTPKQNRKVQEILYAGRHLLNLINEVLDLSRIESGNIPFNLQPIYVKQVIEQAINLVEAMAKEKNVEIQVDRSIFDDIVLFIDETRYKQIIINLLTNAIKYNRTGGNVMIYADIINNHFNLSISDTGYGIPSEVLPKIFDPFYRFKEAEAKVEGTGIGLSIAKLMTEKMGGDIHVESIDKKGSTFSIKFPLISNVIEPKKNGIEQQKNYTFDNKKVLYVEDHPSNAMLVEQIVKNIEGIELEIVYTPGEGIIAAKQMQPDLILMDLNLPGISGYEVFNILQKMKDTSHIPVIALSAAAMEEDKKRALKSGFKGYITKPIEIPAFISTLHEYLEGKVAR